MNRYIKSILLCFCIFSILFLGGIGIGIFSIRNICAIILLFYILRHINRVEFDICQRLYIVYLLVLVVVNFVSGRIFEYEFIQNLLTNHFVCIILFSSIPLLFASKRELRIVLVFLTCVFLFNGFVSVLQFCNHVLGWKIALFFTPGISTYLDQAEYYMQNSDNFLSRSIVSGITGFVVANGYFCAMLLPIISRDLLCGGCSFGRKIIGILFLLLGGICIFMIQQRTAFAIFLLYIFVIFLFRFRVHSLFLFVFAFMIVSSVDIPLNLDMGRLVSDGISDDSRMNQLTNFINFYYTDDFLLGADLSNADIGNSLGHNTLLDALRRGGCFTFVVYLFVFFVISVMILRILIRSYRLHYKYTLVFSISCILFLLYSFTHSTGIQSGAIYFWLMYALMLISRKYEEKSSLSH